MGGFLDAAASFPTAIFSTLLGVVLIYWLLAVLGFVEIDSHGLHLADPAHAGHHDFDDPGALAGIVHALGLDGVPMSVTGSLVVLFGWTLSCLGGMWVLPMLPGDASHWVAGGVMGLASLSIAIPFTRLAIQPLKGLFHTHKAIHNVSLVGQSCKVITGSVDEKVGRAEVPQLGTSLNIRVWSPSPNRLTRGSTARIVAYEDGKGRYRIEAEH